MAGWRWRGAWRARMRRARIVGRSRGGSRSIAPSGCATVGAMSARRCWCGRSGDRPSRLGPLDGGGGAVVRGGLVHGVAGHRDSRAAQTRRSAPGAAAAPGYRRDDVPSTSQFHDRPRGPRRFPLVGSHRGPVQESAGRAAGGGRGGCAQHLLGGDRPLRRLQGRGARRRRRRASPTTSTSSLSPTRRSPTCEPDANRKSPGTAAAVATRSTPCAGTC